MITRHVSLKSKTNSAPSSLALLVLLAWSGAAIGATSLETRCDQSVRASDMPETTPASYSIEVTSDSDEVEQVESVEEAATKAENDDSTETSARLPGVSEDDLIRFKRQMYRKDI